MTFPSQIIKRGDTGIVPLPSLHCWSLPPLPSRRCVRSTLDGVVLLLFSWICSEGTFCLGSLCALGVLMGDQHLLEKKNGSAYEICLGSCRYKQTPFQF